MRADELALVVAYLRRLWPQFRAPQGMLEAWEQLIGDLDVRAVKAAIDDLASDGREWPPPPGLIRRRAVELAGNPPPDVDEAWSEVVTQMARCGSYGDPTWSHSAVAAAVEAFGWRTLCMSDNLVADRSHFMKLYGTIEVRQRREAVQPPSVRSLVTGLASKLELEAG